MVSHAGVAQPDAPTEPTSPSERALLSRLAVPPPPHGLVVRHRLLDKIDLGVQGPLTVVSAPAGTGKTVAVATWAAEGRPPGPLVWISLNDSYLGVDAMWSLVVAGLRRAGVTIRSGMPAAPGPPGTALVESLAVQVAEHRDPITLVVDCDVDLAREAATGLHHLLRDSQGQLHLVLVSRSDPLLPLHLYRLDDAIVEIRMADLAFTTEEARALLAGRGIEASAGVLDVVMARTRGWAAGLLLSSMSLIDWADPDRAAREFTGASGTLAEYLLAEVLDAQTPAMRTLLLRTCVVDALRPGLVEALAGPNAQRALTFLARGNAFLEAMPETPGWYRYHPLFRELLLAQLAYEAPAEAAGLHRVAAQWLAGEGVLTEAVRHAIAAGCWEEAARYVVADLALPEVVSRADDSLNESLARLPDETAGAAPALVRAALALARSDPARCAEHLDQARVELGDAGDRSWPAAALGLAFLTMSYAEATGDHATVLRAASNAWTVLPHQDTGRLAARPEIAATIYAAEARALLSEGRLDEAAHAFGAAAATGPRPGFESGQIDCLGHLALIAAWRGQSRRAIRSAEQALAVSGAADLPQSACSAAPDVGLAWVYADMCDLPMARRHALAADRCATGAGDPMPRLMLAMVESRIHRAHGDAGGARAVLAAAQERDPDAPTWLAEQLRVEEAVVDAVTGQPARVPGVLGDDLSGPARDDAELIRAQARLANGQDLDRPLPPTSAARSSLATRVDKWLVEAMHHLHRGEQQQAAEALDRSLRLAAPERLRRPFREAPSDVRRLFRTRTDLALRHSWLAGAVDGGRRGPRRSGERTAAFEPTPSPIVEPLTKKELEVLGHLADLLTTEEIAGAMFVSVNTVRTHVRSILRKMSVSRRNDAVRRAREMHVLPG